LHERAIGRSVHEHEELTDARERRRIEGRGVRDEL
jgi:hypothetical protein